MHKIVWTDKPQRKQIVVDELCKLSCRETGKDLVSPPPIECWVDHISLFGTHDHPIFSWEKISEGVAHSEAHAVFVGRSFLFCASSGLLVGILLDGPLESLCYLLPSHHY